MNGRIPLSLLVATLIVGLVLNPTSVMATGEIQLNQNAVVRIQLDDYFFNMTASKRCVGLPAIVNNSLWSGIDIGGLRSSIASGNVKLGIYQDAYSRHPYEYVYSPCIGMVKVIYTGSQYSGNFSVVLYIGVDTPFPTDLTVTNTTLLALQGIQVFKIPIRISPSITIEQAQVTPIEQVGLQFLWVLMFVGCCIIWNRKYGY